MANILRSPKNNVSHVYGDDRFPLKKLTIPEMFASAVKMYGSREAVFFAEDGIRLSYAELSEEVDKLASGFMALGLEKGDRIGIWSPNKLEWLLTQFATARIGLIMVNINPAHFYWRLNWFGFFIGLVSWSVVSCITVWLTASIFNILARDTITN